MNYEKYVVKINGEKKNPKIFMFTLSTCIWCKKTKQLLTDLGIEYSHIDVDTAPAEVRSEVESDFEKNNPEMSFPTIIVNDGNEIIVGFQEDRIRELFNV